MPKTYEAIDTIEPADDTMMEDFGNIATYNIISGCAPTYSAVNMNVTVAAGSITHNGDTVTVAGNSVTLVSDPTNPRWSWVGIDSTGTAVLVSGTPAADPAVPERGDSVAVCKVKLKAAQTIADDGDATKLDKRILAPTFADTSTHTLAADDTANSTTTLTDVVGLNAALLASTTYMFRALIHYTAPTAGDYKFTFTVPTSATIYAIVEYFNTGGFSTIGSITASGGTISATGVTTGTGVINVIGSVVNSTNAGDLQYQAALVTASGSCVTKVKSRLEVF